MEYTFVFGFFCSLGEICVSSHEAVVGSLSWLRSVQCRNGQPCFTVRPVADGPVLCFRFGAKANKWLRASSTPQGQRVFLCVVDASTVFQVAVLPWITAAVWQHQYQLLHPHQPWCLHHPLCFSWCKNVRNSFMYSHHKLETSPCPTTGRSDKWTMLCSYNELLHNL